jgi:hypothetical protein
MDAPQCSKEGHQRSRCERTNHDSIVPVVLPTYAFTVEVSSESLGIVESSVLSIHSDIVWSIFVPDTCPRVNAA